MIELICNLHIHSTYSDGTGDYAHIAEAAIASGLDVAIITDHNVLVRGIEKYYHKGDKKVLLLTGEEVHDPDRIPQKSHTLVIGCNEEVAGLASTPQALIDRVNRSGGATFLAHPFEDALPLFNETDITWENWDVSGFTGLELWNGFSEFKTVVKSFQQALFYAFFPELIPHQPAQKTLARWDELLNNGQRVVAVGGSDSHALVYRKGIFRKTIFPYQYHFSTINNHLLIPRSLTGSVIDDTQLIFTALKTGSLFVGNDFPASTKGFSFTAESDNVTAGMGGELDLAPGATIRIIFPRKCNFRLIHNGRVVQTITDLDRSVYTVTEPGYYRVEAYIRYMGKNRGWIFSNPIYFRGNRKYRKI